MDPARGSGECIAVTYNVARTRITIALSVIATINNVVRIASNACFIGAPFALAAAKAYRIHLDIGTHPEGSSASSGEAGPAPREWAQPETPHLIATRTSRQPPGWNRSDSKDRTSRSPAVRLPAFQIAPGFPSLLRLAPCDTSHLRSNNCRKPDAAASGPSSGARAASAILFSPPHLPPVVPPVLQPGLPRFARYDSNAAAACAPLPPGHSLAAQTHKQAGQSRQWSHHPKPEITSNRRAVLSTPFPLTCKKLWSNRLEMHYPPVAKSATGRLLPHGHLSYRNPCVPAKSGPRGLHRIAQHANTLDRHLNRVSSGQRANSRRRARGDHVAGHQRHHPRNPSHQKLHGIPHQRGIPRLPPFAVHKRLHQDVAGIDFRLDVRADRAKRVKALCARELDVTLLQVPCGHIIQAGVPQHISKRILGIRQIRAFFPHDHRQLTLVLDAARVFRQHNRFLRPNHRRRRLQEHHRLLRHFVAQLRRMCRVVPSNAYNLARFHRSRKPHLLDRPDSFSPAPFFPRCLGDFFDLMAFHQSIKRRSVRSARARRIKTAEFHSWKARLVLAMGNVMRTHFPDDRTNPGKRRKDKISHRPQHKNVKTAVVLAQPNKFDAQQQIRNRQKAPAQHPRSKQVQRRTVEAHRRHARKKDENCNRRNVPLSREDFELRNPVRHVHP